MFIVSLFPFPLILLFLRHKIIYLVASLVQTSLSSFMGTLQQDLVSPSKVTRVDAEKLWRELYVHFDQTQVDYVTPGLSKRFRLGFNHLAVSSSMPSLSLHPSVIDQCLLIELEKVP